MIIRDVTTIQGEVKQSAPKTKSKLQDLTLQAMEEITTQEATIVIEVDVAKAAMQ